MKELFKDTRSRVLAAVAAWFALCFAYFGFFLATNGSLPEQFFVMSDDTFMDYFNITALADQRDRYTQWGSIYPIFSFLLGFLASDRECYIYDAFYARDHCTDAGLYVMFAASLVAAYQNARLFTSNKLERPLVFLVIVLSYPFLFALERGQYVLYAYIFLVLAASCKWKISEGIWLAAAINVKPYLLVVLAHPFLNRDYRVLLSCVFATVVLTAASVAYLDEPNYLMAFENIAGYSESNSLVNLVRLMYSVSPNSFVTFAKSADGRFFLDFLEYLFPLLGANQLIWFASVVEIQVYGLIAIVGLRMLQLGSTLDKGYVGYVMLLCLLAKFEAPGLYGLILLFVYLPTVLPVLSRSELLLLFLLMQPFDYLLFGTWNYTATSYLSGAWVTTNVGMTFGTVYRPTVIFLLLLSAAWYLVRKPRNAAGAGKEETPDRALAPSFGNSKS